MTSKPLKTISVKAGRKTTILNVQDIFVIRSSSPYIELSTNRGKFLYSSTLGSILENLDSDRFIRVHKSAIVNIDKVSSWTSRLNGDYDITMQNGEVVRMSRNFSTEFKQHFS